MNSRRSVGLAVASLLLMHYALALGGVWDKSTTYDETAHITAGYTFWRFDDYRLQPENGNLPQRLAALPLAISDVFTFPSRDQAAWRESDVWTIGDQFFHSSGNNLESLLRRSRAGMALLSAALCLIVFLWARSLYGATGGVISLVLCVFSPIILANGPLATSDTCATLFFLLSVWSLWRLLQRITFSGILACGAALSGLALSKTSAALIFPMIALMIPAALLGNSPLTLRAPGGMDLAIVAAPRRLAAMIGAVLICVLFAWGAIWVSFGCRYAPVAPREQAGPQQYFFPGQPLYTLSAVAAEAGFPGKLISYAGSHRLFPEAFLYGTAYVLASEHHYGFLNGDLSVHGWKLFFPYCFLVKSTLPLLLLFVTALVATAAAGVGASRKNPLDPPLPKGETVPLWILLAVYVPALIFSTINIGARHMLPLYPAIFILLGGLARRMTVKGLRWWVLLLLLWHVGEGLRGYPHYLAYFNQIIGREKAYRHLVDSSLDWGQDLPGLKTWLDRRLAGSPRTRAYLSYFGTGSPAYYGIAAEPIELDERHRRGLSPLGGGVYCVSATDLQAVYAPIRGRWNSRYEDDYRKLRRSGEHLDPEEKLRQLGTARLMAFLREREPDAEIGYSILCYELSQGDINRAFAGPPPEIEQYLNDRFP